MSEGQTASLRTINAKLMFLPKNATRLCKPADSFVIQKIKQRWRTLWDEDRVRLIKYREWMEGLLLSGTPPNPGKRYFLKVYSCVVREVNYMRQKRTLVCSKGHDSMWSVEGPERKLANFTALSTPSKFNQESPGMF